MIKVGQIVSDITANMNPFRKDMTKVKQEGEKAAKGVESSFQQLGQRMRRTGTIMTAAVTAPVVAGFAKMSKEAALLEGAMAKFNVVFGDASDEMEQWVNEFRKEVPLARTEIIKAASAMQDLLVPMGIAREEATGMSKQWLTLASRLAAFNDVPVDQALEAIRSGIAGMSRPLRQFGIDARQTVLQQVALQEGLIEAGEEMDEQARQQALLIQAYDQSSDALEGFEEQQDSLLLMQQEVTASIKDMAASFGGILIPAAKSVTQSVSSLVKTISGLSEEVKRSVLIAAGLLGAGGPLLVAVGTLTAALGAISWPVVLGVAAFGTATAAIVSKWDSIVRYFTSGGGSELWDSIKHAASGLWDALKALFSVGSRIVQNIWRDWGKQLFQIASSTVSAVLKITGSLFKSMAWLLHTFSGNWNEAWFNLVEAAAGILSTLHPALAATLNAQTAMMRAKLDKQRGLIGDFASDVDEVVNNMGSSGETVSFGGLESLFNFINTDLSNFSGGLSELTDTEQLQTANATAVSFTNTLGLMNPKLNVMANGLQMAKGAASSVSEAMKVTRDEVSKAAQAGGQFGQMMGNALSQAVLHANSLLDTLKNLAKQLASKVLTQGLAMLLSGGTMGGGGLIGSLLGGMFHEGGIVGGSGDVPIMAKAGEGVFTEGQMKAMGGLMRGGGQQKTVQLNITGSLEGNGSQLRAVINESQHIDLS